MPLRPRLRRSSSSAAEESETLSIGQGQCPRFCTLRALKRAATALLVTEELNFRVHKRRICYWRSSSGE